MACCSGCLGDPLGLPDLADVWATRRDIESVKRRVDPDMRATDAAVAACTKLSVEERASWRAFYAGWRFFCDTPTIQQVMPLDWTGLFDVGATGAYKDGLAAERRLKAWQDQIRAKCSLVAPPIDPDARSGDGSVIKWAAAAVIVGALVYGVRTVMR